MRPSGSDRTAHRCHAADEAATEALRASMRAGRPAGQPFFDRGPGYALLSGGETHNEFDLL